MDVENELNVNSIYDYLLYGRGHSGEYKLVILITKKQVVLSTKKKNKDDHWNMIVDINKVIYPERNYDENNISKDTIIFTSLGSDLEVEIPNQISESQLEEVKNILRQVNHFEYDNDTYLFMPSTTSEILYEANKKIKEYLPEDEDEIIVGTPINNRTK